MPALLVFQLAYCHPVVTFFCSVPFLLRIFFFFVLLCRLLSSWPMQRLPAHVLPLTLDLCPLSCTDVPQSLSGGAVIGWRALRGL